eukprot:jgi/Mesvir1/11649/Mv00050-RA.1
MPHALHCLPPHKAIWDEAAKAAMVRAAAAAGMVKSTAAGAGSCHPPLLVLEPEAASLYAFRTVTNGELADVTSAMIVDAGGGTVDVVVHALEPAVGDGRQGLRMREVCRGTGDLCGGSFVDAAFDKYLAARVPCLAEYKKRFPREAARLGLAFERHKRTFSGAEGDAWILDLPQDLARMWARHRQAAGEVDGDGDVEDCDELEVSASDMRSIFAPVVNRTLHLMDKALRAAQGLSQPGTSSRGGGCDAIIMAGGFSSSPYLLSCVKERFGHRVRSIVRPPDPGSAIVQGAVLYGLDPDMLSSRVSRKTYGVGIMREFVPASDPADKRVVIDGCAMCDDVFLYFVQQGENVPVDKVVSHPLFATSPSQTQFMLDIWSTVGCPPGYVTDGGMQCEGLLLLELPDARLGLGRSVNVQFLFGQTQIEVQVVGSNCRAVGEVKKTLHFCRQVR